MQPESFGGQKDVKEGTEEALRATKKQGLQQLLEQLETSVKALTKSRDDTREMAKDAPSANQSHSDTSKFQLSNLQLSLDASRLETEKTIFLLQKTPLNRCDKIALGAIFTIREVASESMGETYFLVSAGGGEEITLENINVVSITPGAPLVRACLHKNKGDTFVFMGKKFEITSIV